MLQTRMFMLLTLCVCVFSVGCQSQKAGPDIDNTAAWTLDDLTAPIHRPKTQKSWEDWLPWNWETAEEKRSKTDEILFAEDDVQEEPFLEKIAFWKPLFAERPMSEEDYLNDMSPELDTLSERKNEVKGRLNRTVDTNSRAIWNDLYEGLLLERPSRANRIPVP